MHSFSGTAALALVMACSANVLAAGPIVLGDLAADPATTACLGVYLPILSGDDDLDAVAVVRFRESGTASWRTGLPLLRVRPEQISRESPPGSNGLPVPARQFAGSLFGLKPATSYEVEVTVTDPDGGGGLQAMTTATAAIPPDEPLAASLVPVNTTSALANALATATPGTVILIAAGAYAGPFTISRAGTAASPIVVRGASRDAVTINAPGSAYGFRISASYVHLEDLTVSGSDWGLRVSDTTGVAVRRTRITNVNKGIYGYSGTTRNLYVCDNVLEGRKVWPDVSGAVINEEGIVVSGQGHTICHNTLSGFGDALGLRQTTSIINAAIDFYGNEVLWTGDDGIELDYAHRNVRAFGNRISNASMGVSFQPVWGGPVYVFRNVLVNMARSPYKLNNDPTGFYILNNTSVRSLGIGDNGAYAWPSLGYTQSYGTPAYAANFQFRNNIVIGVSGPAFVTTELLDARVDANGWWPDGPFTFFSSWANLADLVSNSPFEANGRILNGSPFLAPVTLGSDYTSFIQPPSVVLAAGSNAVDGGQELPNVTDEFVGAAPDLGAWERGRAIPVYGVRPAADGDSDSVPDSSDNCSASSNPDQRDSNGDGFGNSCDADLSGDRRVNFEDLAAFKLAFGSTDPDADLTGDGRVNFEDLAAFKRLFGKPAGPSGLVP